MAPQPAQQKAVESLKQGFHSSMYPLPKMLLLTSQFTIETNKGDLFSIPMTLTQCLVLNFQTDLPRGYITGQTQDDIIYTLKGLLPHLNKVEDIEQFGSLSNVAFALIMSKTPSLRSLRLRRLHIQAPTSCLGGYQQVGLSYSGEVHNRWVSYFRGPCFPACVLR